MKIAVSFSVLLIAVSVPGLVSAQCDIYPQGLCGGSSQSAVHSAVAGGTGGGNHHGTVCYTCRCNGELCTPDHCHTCGFYQDGEEGGEYALLLEAVDAGDMAETLRLAPRVRSHVYINHERSALQVLSCAGDGIVANIPMSDAQLAALHSVIDLGSGRRAIAVGSPSLARMPAGRER